MDDETIAFLAAQLSDDTPPQQDERGPTPGMIAHDKLLRSGEPRVVQFILPLLEHPLPVVRLRAAEILVPLGGEEARVAITAHATEMNRDAALDMGLALAQLTSDKLALSARLLADPSTRLMGLGTARALDVAGLEQLMALLLLSLRDVNEEVRSFAAHLLWTMAERGAPAKDILIDMVLHDAGARYHAERALHRIGLEDDAIARALLTAEAFAALAARPPHILLPLVPALLEGLERNFLYAKPLGALKSAAPPEVVAALNRHLGISYQEVHKRLVFQAALQRIERNV